VEPALWLSLYISYELSKTCSPMLLCLAGGCLAIYPVTKILLCHWSD
jgi:hypothetical protein